MQKGNDTRPYSGTGNLDFVGNGAEATRIDCAPFRGVSPRSKSRHDSMSTTNDRKPEQQNDVWLQGSYLFQKEFATLPFIP